MQPNQRRDYGSYYGSSRRYKTEDYDFGDFCEQYPTANGCLPITGGNQFASRSYSGNTNIRQATVIHSADLRFELSGSGFDVICKGREGSIEFKGLELDVPVVSTRDMVTVPVSYLDGKMVIGSVLDQRFTAEVESNAFPGGESEREVPQFAQLSTSAQAFLRTQVRRIETFASRLKGSTSSGDIHIKVPQDEQNLRAMLQILMPSHQFSSCTIENRIKAQKSTVTPEQPRNW